MFQPTDTAATLQDYLPLLTVIVATIGAYFALTYANKENKKDIEHLKTQLTMAEANIKATENHLTEHKDSPYHPTRADIQYVTQTLHRIEKAGEEDRKRITTTVDNIYRHLMEKNHR